MTTCWRGIEGNQLALFEPIKDLDHLACVLTGLHLATLKSLLMRDIANLPTPV